MPQDDPNDESPWLRDDWIDDRAVSDAAMLAGRVTPVHGDVAEASVRDAEESPGGAETRGDRARTPARAVVRAVVGASVGIVLVVGAGALLLRDDGEPVASSATDAALDTQPDPTAGEVVDTTTPEPTSPASIASVHPAPPVGAGVIPSIVAGEPPAWEESTIAVRDDLAALASTEVITLTPFGVVNVTELPSGRTRSIDVSGSLIEPQLAFGDGTIVVFDSSTLLLIRDGEPVVESSLSDGVIFVQPWAGTGTFVVTSPSTGPDAPPQDWVLGADGTLQLLDARIAGEARFWSRAFSPDGDVLVSGPGGVYAIDPAGVARRISTGDLLATGDRHWAIEECDDTLRCAYSVVAWDTGEVTPGVLDPIAGGSFIDPATRISPDGRSIAYRADTDGTGRRRILDVATGTSVEAGRINQLVQPDAWAADSSGLFVTDRFLRFVDRITGATIEIDGLEAVRTVATGAFSRSPG